MKITIITLGTRGDVQPCIAVGRGLQACGHEVRIAAPYNFGSSVLEWGLNFFPIRNGFREIYEKEPGGNRLREELNPFRLLCRRKVGVEPIVNRIFSDLWTACQNSEAILYTSLALPVHYIAKDLGIPAFAACFQPLSRTCTFPSLFFPPYFSNVGALNRASHLLVEQAIWHFFRSFLGRWRKKSGLSPVPFWGHFNRFYDQNNPVLNGYSPLVAPKPPDWGDRMHITGYWFLESPSGWTPCPKLVDFLESGEPPVCVGFGSMNDNRVAERVRISIEALRKTGKRGIFLVGNSDMSRKEILIHNDIFVVGEVPHSWLFSRVSTVIHHGGAGTTAAAIRAGVPSIIVPFFFDQGFWGRRLSNLGVGPKPLVKKGLSVDTLAATVRDTVKNDEYLQRLQTLSAQIRAENGVQNAVDVFHHELSRYYLREGAAVC